MRVECLKKPTDVCNENPCKRFEVFSSFLQEVHKEIRELYLPRYTEQYSSSHLSALDIAAEEMRTWHELMRDEQTVRVQQEERTVYSQIIHALTLMVFFRFPVNISEKKHAHALYGGDGQESVSSQITR